MKKIIIFLLSSICLFANIGTVVDVVGDATLVRNGKNIQVVQKLELKEHDFVKTGKNAKVKIFFKDNTAVSLGQNTSFEIDSYLFTGKQDSNIKFKVLKGFFKTVTGEIGKIAPKRFKLQTKNATIGIRGTVFAAEVGDDADVVMCTDGRIMLFTPNGDIEVNSGSRAYARTFGAPQVKQYSQKEKEQLIKNAGWHGSMTLEELKEFIKKNFKEPLRSQLLAAIENIYDKDSSESRQTIVQNADDIGFVDEITINDREFDELPRDIEFYSDDLEDGKVIVRGILESEDKAVHVNTLFVEITTDGGDSWTRAKGNSDWEWSFSPKIEKPYDFSLRVVQDIKGAQSDDFIVSAEPEDVEINLSDTITIAGFKLTLNADANLQNGKLNGSGSIEIPYLSKITNIANKIDVNFENLTVLDNIVTLGDITYNTPFTIETPIADLNINSMVFSPTPANNKIVGNIAFKDTLASSLGTIDLPSTSKFLPTSFDLNVPFEAQTINIWREKGVLLYVSSGAFTIGYNLGDDLPKVDFDIPSAQFKFGTLLTYAQGVEVQFGLEDFGRTPTVEIPQDVYLLDTGIKIPKGLSLSFDLKDYSAPSFSFSSSVNLDGFTNEFAQNLNNANLSATISSTGLSGTLTASGGIDPVTILERGSEQDDVRLVFEGESPSFTFNITNEMPEFSLSGVTPKIYFGNLFTNLQGQSLNKSISLGSIETPTLNLTDSMYLLGSKIKLPSGFNASVDLSDLEAPVLTFDIGLDFSAYDENIIAKHISGAKIVGTLSTDGFQGTITSDKPSSIDIYKPKDVKIVFNGESGPSFGINITGTESLPKFNISNIDADLDFGSLLTTTDEAASSVIASIGTITENGVQALSLSLPTKVKLLDSNLAFQGIISSLNLSTKNIKIASSVDLSGYKNNTILNALNGSAFDMDINPTSFVGTITVEDDLEPINIWAQKKVKLTINGKPSIGVTVDGSGVGFDFGELSAFIDFGDLLTTAQNGAESAIATFSQAVDDLGNYSVTLSNDVYLLGSKFALKAPEINFNPNVKSISLSSSVNLSLYTEPAIKAFDGATFSATISSTGFSGSLSKEGGFDPIVVLDRGGVGKDVSVKFTTSPVVSVEIKNSGVDFGFSGGEADIHFGDLLNGKTASLKSLKDGMYSWELEGKNKLYSEAKAIIKDIKNAKLDIKDFSNPKIFFDANIDLSEYKGALSSVQSVELKDVIISKSGFKASLSASLGKVDIWKEKNVYMDFLQNPTISISLNTSGFDMGFSNLAANLNFGDLLDNAEATIGDVLPQDGVSSLLSGVKSSVTDTGREIVQETALRWNIDINNIPLLSSNILLSELGGSIDLSDFSNPQITLNGLADLSGYGTAFKYVTKAGLKNVSISKSGFSGSLSASLSDINIWKEKNVKLVFDKSPQLNLKVNSSGVKLGITDISASVHLGTLLNDSEAKLRSLEDDFYSWEIDGKNQLADTALFLENLKGKINLADLKSPELTIFEANVSGLDSVFKSVTLKNAKISKSGFDAYVSATMDDLELYEEDSKKIELKFQDGLTPTLHVKLNLSGLNVGLSNFNADIAFTNMLNNQSISLSQLMESDVPIDGNFEWELPGTHTFLANKIVVNTIGGSLDLSNWKNPVAVFHTTATFTDYEVLSGVNLSGVFDVSRAEIKKTSIEWNVSAQNARINTKILELGDGANDDVRVELKNVNASAGSSGASISGADGTLFFGKLFSKNKHIGLTYQTADSGLKTYGFSFSEDLVYKQDDDNFITLQSPSGTLVETSEGVYKVVLDSSVIAHSSALSAISIGELSASDFEVSGSGFEGDAKATFTDFSTSILSEKVSIELTKVGIHVDSSQELPIKLNELVGSVDISSFFDEADKAQAKAALAFVSDSISWSLPEGNVLHVKDNFEFKNLSGTLDLASSDYPSIGVSGDFSYKGISENISLSDDFKISADGLEGSISLNNAKIELFDKLFLNYLQVTFGTNIEGSMKVLYENSSFLSTGEALNLGLNATIDRDGVDSFGVDVPEGQELASVDIPNFAVFNFTGAEASEDFSDFWVSLGGNVKLQHSILNADANLNFTDLKLSEDGVSVKNAGVFVETDASASLGGLGMNINQIGLGVEGDLFYVRAKGDLSLVIASVKDADVTLYSNKKIKVNEIAVNINQNYLTASGSIGWYDENSPNYKYDVYGNSFAAQVSVSMKSVFTGTGKVRIGQKGELFYWMADASGGVGNGIPFGPLKMFKVGGGVAYNMIYNSEAKDFIPTADSLTLMLNTTLGTSSDNGYIWHGDIQVSASVVGDKFSQLALTGDSWIMSDLSEKPSKQYIGAEITFSDTMFQATATADIVYNKITVKGKLDTVISSNEKHLFIGTDPAYAFAFQGYKELGHVTVGIFGFDGYGFFMVDQNAIAFGEGVKVDKKWSKDWWGPDPSLRFKLNAGLKALLIYRPEYQFMAQAYVEVTLAACYGGCLEVGADAKVDVAIGNQHNYVFGKAGIKIFGKSIHFDGYIYGSGDIQRVPKIDLDIYDKVTPASQTDISLMPLFKVYSNFQKSTEGIDVEVTNFTLIEGSVSAQDYAASFMPNNSSNYNHVALEKLPLEGDYMGATYMVKTGLLKRDTTYTLLGRMTGTYEENGKIETDTEVIHKVFKTTQDDKVSFEQLVSKVTPKDGANNINESSKIHVYYNKLAVDRLEGGVHSKYHKNYEIKVEDADNNDIPGTFTEPTTGDVIVSTFQPSKKLRIYRYCVNEEGDVRETFVANGKYLNPFNDFTEDDGVEEVPNSVVNNTMQAQTPTLLGGDNLALDNDKMKLLLLAAQSADGSSGGLQMQQSQQLSQKELSIAQAMPATLLLGNKTFKNPNKEEALGTKLHSSFSRGKSYTYYRANLYKIKVFDKLAQGAEVYTSKFEVAYNDTREEAKRKVEQMQGVLNPTITVSFDVDRIGSSGIMLGTNLTSMGSVGSIYASNQYNNGFYNELRYKLDDGLLDIYVTSGIKTKVTGTFQIEKNDGSMETMVRELSGEKVIFPGIVREFSVDIEYLTVIGNNLILSKEMSIIPGAPFSVQEEEAKKQLEEDIAEMKGKIKKGKVGVKVGDIVFGGGFSGGAPQVGGGATQYGAGQVGSVIINDIAGKTGVKVNLGAGIR